MATKRQVPFIIGLAAIGLAVWLTLAFSGWARAIVAALLLWFGWASLKTAWSATDKEIAELTGERTLSQETEERFKDRL